MTFNIVTADPPWLFADKLPKTRGADSHYDTMTWQDICQLELPEIADDAILFLWRVAAMQEEALAVMHMWGFDLKSELVWVKTKKGVVEPESTDDLAFGMGHYTRHCHEVCLIGTRGKASKLINSRSIRSVFFAERLAHSEKPEEFFRIVEEMTITHGPRLELFARKQRPGWVCLGNELGTVLQVRRDNASEGTSGNGSDGSQPGSERVLSAPAA